jgi:inner membrane protein
MKIPPLAIKIALVAAVMAVLLVGLAMIGSLVSEREGRYHEATTEIGASWGKAQVLAGPYLRLPLKSMAVINGATTTQQVIILPETLDAKVNVETDERHRGIYTALLYAGKATIGGTFVMPDLKAIGIDTANILWDQVTLEYSLSDTRGIPTPLNVTWNGTDRELHPSTASSITMSGQVIATSITLDHTATTGSVIGRHNITIAMRGSETLEVAPLGKTTTLSMQSTWPHPSFQGSILPDRHNTSQSGFDAVWRSGHFARSYGQAFIVTDEITTRITNSSFGVSFKDPVDLYRQLERSTKYVVLVVLLTFALFFTLEVISKRRIHAMQYLLVGFALLVFYLMLIAYSELLRFDLSYVISAFLTTLLVTLYMRFVTGTIKHALLVGGLLSALFVFIYTLLQAETYSLMIGSVGMFIAVAGLMYSTRKIDWHEYR